VPAVARTACADAKPATRAPGLQLQPADLAGRGRHNESSSDY